jgi:hypothetical protein
VDLGSVLAIGEVVLHHAGAGGEPQYMNTRDYSVQFSRDGVSWETVTKVTGNTANVTHHLYRGNPARYVRLKITKPTGTSLNRAGICEVEVRV